MFKIPLADLKEKIVSTGKISAEELETKIKDKINELSGLISEDGAAHIIANELGVDMTPPDKGKLKIKEIYAGMKGVITVGKVVQKYEVREFAKGESTGKVGSLLIGDETGTIRVVFWNDQVSQLQDINEDDIILVNNAYARENRNNRELHLGERGSVDINPKGEKVESVRKGTEFQRKMIKDLSAGETGVEVMGTVVQVFDPRYFMVDVETGKRVQDGGVLSYVTNAVVDDGSGTVRCVFWKNQTNHLLTKSDEEMGMYKEQPGKFEDVKTDLLGEQFRLMGKVVRNDMFDRLEFSVQMVEKADPEKELKRLEKDE
ncbi:hypothetical protein COV20_04805 [Candidatus Woesearchaeota archaeon CG10_big_fil_rev_8_21_14_0_10_45_16]|nr:MAG: hypothetical protein COV20_04805 [Candidatus Woesearchaeota archaeon CG10_big_fil_rev_8_21_14_0_10_45_16]